MIIGSMIGAAQYKSTSTPYDFPDMERFPEKPENGSNPVTQEGVNLGRHLFYDPVLSNDSNQSCSSCHQQAKAFSGNRHKVKTKRDVPPLFNLAWHPSYGWDGRSQSIENHILETVPNPHEMNLSWSSAIKRVSNTRFYQSKFEKAFGKRKIDSTLIAKALGQFLRTLLSYQSKFDKALTPKTQLNQQELRGFELVTSPTKGNCLHCHTIDRNPLGSDFKYRDIGLQNARSFEAYIDKGRGRVTGKKSHFGQVKTPSLRNIVLTAPYMHNGRLKSLEAVLNFYDTGIHQTPNRSPILNRDIRLNEKEKQQMLAFFQTLTDSAFMNKDKFGNPFEN